MISTKRAVLLCLFVSGLTALVMSFISFGNPRAGRMEELSEISQIIDEYYFYGADEDAMFDGAAKGMMRAIEDNYAAYYTKAEYDNVSQRDSGEFIGAGLVLEMRDGFAYISEVFEDSPAAKAGLMRNDLVLRIDGKGIAGYTFDETAALIPNTKGETVQFVVNRGGANEVVDVTIDEIVRKRVRFKMIDDKAYIAIEQFTGDCVSGFTAALGKAVQNKAKGLIIDLRGNPGGYLDAVVEIADMLLGEGVILTVSSKSGEQEVYHSDNLKIGLPMVLLVNGSSASASEVLAGAVADSGAGVLVGERTFGKGIVQTTFSLNTSDAKVKLTTAAYQTPSGANIHGVGIQPDFEVELSKDAQEKSVRSLALAEDKQLQAAIKILDK